MLTVEDEYTREGLAVEVGRSLPSGQVKAALARLFAERGLPEYIRSDNGPEFIARELTGWLTEQGVQTHPIAPGSPWQNAYGESFNAILRRECLNQETFHSVRDARTKTLARGGGTTVSGRTVRSGTGHRWSSGTGCGSRFWNAGSLRRTAEGRRMVGSKGRERRTSRVSRYCWYEARGTPSSGHMTEARRSFRGAMRSPLRGGHGIRWRRPGAQRAALTSTILTGG